MSNKPAEMRRDDMPSEGISQRNRQEEIDRRISIAPMMDRSDKHFRFLTRVLAPNALLYTEMITARALLRGDAQRLLRFDPAEHPVALQLGGADPEELA